MITVRKRLSREVPGVLGCVNSKVLAFQLFPASFVLIIIKSHGVFEIFAMLA